MSALSNVPTWLMKRSTLWILIVPLIAGAVLAAQFGTPLIVGLYTFFCVNVMLVLGLQMFMGNSGILAWTYVGFMGIGAFAASIMSVEPMMKRLGVPNMYPALVEIHLPIPAALILGGVEPPRLRRSSPGRSCVCPTPWESSPCSRRSS